MAYKNETKETLCAHLQELIARPPEDADETQLRQQNDVLNSIFKRMLSDADSRYDYLIQYSLALRAQNQFVRTLQLARDIKTEDIALKNDKRTEQKHLEYAPLD